VYGRGRHLNRYPHHAVVGFVLGAFGKSPDRAGLRFLELGCGAGNNVWFAAREGFGVAGIDGSESAIAYARKRFADEGLAGDLRVGDFVALPWPDAQFDLVIDRGSLTCCTQSVIRSALAESRRVLKPGGRLFSIIYSDQHPGRDFGRDMGDNTYTDFTGGYFSGLGTAHFCPRAELDDVYGTHFELSSLTHSAEVEHLGQAPGLINAFWKILGTRKP
jgi:SAM-dependent methyltransferase